MFDSLDFKKMKRVLLTLKLLLISALLGAQVSPFKTFGGPKNDFGVSILERNSGNQKEIIVAGSTRSFGSGSSDYYVLTLNNWLQLDKESYIGGDNVDILNSMMIGPQNDVTLFGSTFGFIVWGGQNFTLTKIDENEDFVSRHVIYNSRKDIGYKAITTSDKNIALIGMAQATDAWGKAKFMVLDTNNNVLLEKDYGPRSKRVFGFDVIENKLGYAILFNVNCEIGVSADFPGFIDFSNVSILQVDKTGDSLWQYDFQGDENDFAYSMVQHNDQIFIAINTRSGSAQSFDTKVLKLDLNGNIDALYDYGGVDYEYINKIIVDSQGYLVLCGVSASGVKRPSFYALKIDEFGSVIWEKKIEDSASIEAFDVIQRANGNFLFTGRYTQNFGNDDVFVLELDEDGEFTSVENQTTKLNYNLFPNPTKDYLHIRLNSNKVGTIKVIDIQGRALVRKEIQGSNDLVKINLSALIQGIYFIDIEGKNGVHVVEKIILQK